MPNKRYAGGAGWGQSERRNVDTLIPLARQRESSSCPSVPCERRTLPQQKVRRRSGIDPEPALEANTLISGAKRQGLNFPSFPAGEGSIPRSPQGTHPQRQPRQATGPFDVRLAPFV